MRSREYGRRKRIRPGIIKNPSRYVVNRLRSHSRPNVQVPLDLEPEDSPTTRGLTTDDI